MPLVSVIIPVHNGEAALRSTLGSVVAQTLRDIEIIVVDDASTDGTRQIIEDFVAKDSRVHYEVGPGVGSASAARNVGLDLATGTYLAFLDADDFFAPTMLETLSDRAREDDADIVLTKFRTVDHVTGDATPADWALRLQYFPARTPISPNDLGDYLFFAVNPAAWNKLFRTDFIRGSGLRFQHLRRTNDVYFSYMALALAQRISVAEGYLVDYRVNNPGSLQGSLHESPLEFVKALERLSGHLAEAGLFEKLERAFVNQAVEISLTNLRKVSSAQAFADLHNALRTEIFSRFGVLNRAPGYFLRDELGSQVKAIMELSSEELLFSRLVKANDATARARAEIREALREMEVRANAARLDAVERTAPLEFLRDPVASPALPGSRPDVSVVIPVHNTERFLEECLQSVLAQSGVQLEVICVDDGSTDSSGDVLDQLAARDSRICVLHQGNAGPSVARNRGMEVATGRYLCFMDSDDWWQLDGLASLVQRADEEKIQLLLFDASPHREAGVPDRTWDRFRSYYERATYEGVRSGPELLAAMRAVKEYRASPCLYLISADHVRRSGLRFYPGIVHEDNLFTFELMLATHRAAHSRTYLYARRVRPGSIMTAGSRLASARGYLITYLEMLRLAGRGRFDEPVATQIGAIIFSAYKQAIDNFVKVNTDVGDRLREVDPSPEAQAAVMLLKRLRYEAQFKRGSAKPAKLPAHPKPRSLPVRAMGKLRRMVRQLAARSQV